MKWIRLYVLLVLVSTPVNYLLGYTFPSLLGSGFSLLAAVLCSSVVVLVIFAIAGGIAVLYQAIGRSQLPCAQATIVGLWVVAHIIPFVGMYVLETRAI